jgi:hypothetical protein
MSRLVPNKPAFIKKQKELQDLALSFIPENVQKRDELAKALTDSFIELTPPFMGDEITRLDMIRLTQEGIGGAESTKAGNIYLNFGKLLRLAPDIVLTIYGATGPVWILFFVALHLWSAVWQESTVELDQSHAMAIYAMWMNKDQNRQISEDDAFHATNAHLARFGIPLISRSYFAAIIDNLSEMGCIEINEGRIWLREWVKTSY